MELLDQLEQRIQALLAKSQALAAENRTLTEVQAQECSALAEENRVLKEELEKERARNKTALTRIEALVERIKEQTD